jgi:carboxypeptidase C (cathepsin A)
LPANTTAGRDYDINSFFIFFEARENPENAPLTLWLQGGPGTPSVQAALGENGPCVVTRDSKTTKLNPWSWNNVANMLYLDQPVQVGFSYDELIQGTINEVASPFTVIPKGPHGLSEQNDTTVAGTFSSQNPLDTAATTSTAAVAAWQFMQVWMKNFPQYRPKNDKISIWGESYGGHYVPTFSSFFEAQNELIDSASEKCPIKLGIDTVGIVNGCIDMLTQVPFYPKMAKNNTYGLDLMSDEAYAAAVKSFPKCKVLTEACQSAAYRLDPMNTGANDEVNQECKKAFDFCYNSMAGPFVASGVSLVFPYDSINTDAA